MLVILGVGEYSETDDGQSQLRETSQVPIRDTAPQVPSSLSLKASLRPEKDCSKLCF